VRVRVGDASADRSHRPYIDADRRSPVVVRTGPAVVPSSVGVPRVGPTVVATVLAAVVVAVLWIGVATGSLLAAVDPAVDAWFVTARSPGLVSVAVVISTVGQPAVVIGVLVVVASWMAWRSRSWGPVAVTASALALLGVLDNGVKAIVARPRPPVVWQAIPAHGLAFPSGHALWSAGTLLLVVVLVGPFRGRPALAPAALVVVLAITGSRLVLAVHYPSDVLAGWGLAVLADGIVLLVTAGVLPGRAPRSSSTHDPATSISGHEPPHPR
jgi:membrane-associated phospholipid phosphatase